MALKPIRVSQLNKYIGRILRTDPVLGNISVVGEISNLKYHSTGHVYFNLKDENSTIKCFLAASDAQNLHYVLTDGLEIVVTGYISVYERGGYYSINVRFVDIEGAGNLNAAFRALQTKLEKEGLFDKKYKKALPFFPDKVVVITSPTGAAVRDIIKIITGKNNYVDIMVYPCIVQGENAALDISSALDHVNSRFPEVDIIIVGRGGGSTEELWAFNEEIAARSIFKSVIPVISAVGHETDITIADLVADVRAETPTAAAQLAVPDTYKLREGLEETQKYLVTSINRYIKQNEYRLTGLNVESLGHALRSKLTTLEMKAELHIAGIRGEINTLLSKLDYQTEKLKIVVDMCDPQEIINRGYTALLDNENRLITTIGNVSVGDKVKVIMKDGQIGCLVENKDDDFSQGIGKRGIV